MCYKGRAVTEEETKQELLRQVEIVRRRNREVLRRTGQRTDDLERMAEYSVRVVDRAVRRLRAANGR
jgi:hypothetical protein